MERPTELIEAMAAESLMPDGSITIRNTAVERLLAYIEELEKATPYLPEEQGRTVTFAEAIHHTRTVGREAEANERAIREQEEVLDMPTPSLSEEEVKALEWAMGLMGDCNGADTIRSILARFGGGKGAE